MKQLRETSLYNNNTIGDKRCITTTLCCITTTLLLINSDNTVTNNSRCVSDKSMPIEVVRVGAIGSYVVVGVGGSKFLFTNIYI